MKDNWKRCIELDLDEYKHGIISKRQLCQCIAEDLEIIAMPYWEFILLNFVSAIILITLTRWLY